MIFILKYHRAPGEFCHRIRPFRGACSSFELQAHGLTLFQLEALPQQLVQQLLHLETLEDPQEE